MTTIATLASNVQYRLEEPSSGLWWSLGLEVNSAVAEAMNDLMMLVGRPTQEVNVAFTLQPNTCFQAMPTGLFALTNIYGPDELRRVTLSDMDSAQASWTSDWQQDVAQVAVRWFPIGFNMFGVHPAPIEPQNVTITGIQYPLTAAWPYTGSETVPFEETYLQALEEYAAGYCRMKELGGEMQLGVGLYQEYLKVAQRMTMIQGLRDSLISTIGAGVAGRINPTTGR